MSILKCFFEELAVNSKHPWRYYVSQGYKWVSNDNDSSFCIDASE
jgi:hypothetical protein